MIARSLFSAVALLVITATPVHAQSGNLSLHLALTGYVSAAGADLSTTMYALGTGRARETNAVFAPLSTHPAIFGAANMGTIALTSWAILVIHRDHPKAAFWVAILGASLHTAVTVHNLNVIHHRRP